MLVVADRLNLMDFPVALGIRLNIPQLELRDIVWEQVARDLTAQGVLDLFGEPNPEVAAMVDTLSRADRTLECRWWRRDVGGKMVRFVVCRKGDRHVVAARDGDMLVLQRVAPAGRLGGHGDGASARRRPPPADVEPLTGVASQLAECRNRPTSSRRYGQRARVGAHATPRSSADPASWVEITAVERHPGGAFSHGRRRGGRARLPAGADRVDSHGG